MAEEEALFDYRYVERVMATEADLDLLKVAQSASGLSNTQELKSEMKGVIRFIRDNVCHITTIINTHSRYRTHLKVTK